MPEPARPPWLVDPALVGISVGRLVEEDAAVILVCHACRHRARWGAPDLRERLYGRRKSTFHEIAPRLRVVSPDVV